MSGGGPGPGIGLAGLAGAGVVAQASLADVWLDPKWQLAESTEQVQLTLFGLSLVCLGVSAVLALVAVWRLGDGEGRPPGLRWSCALFVVAVVLVLAQALSFAVEADPEAATPAGGRPVVDEPERPTIEDAEVLARQYAPVVWIHPKEKFGPQAVDEFLKRSALYWYRETPRSDSLLIERGAIDPDRLGRRCGGTELGCYTKKGFLASEMTRPHDDRSERPQRLTTAAGFTLVPDEKVLTGEVGVEPRAPIFYEVEIEGEKRIRIAYWFFFGFSRPYEPIGIPDGGSVMSHQGDWENIEVVLDGARQPQAVLYYSHGKKPHREAWVAACKMVEEREECGSSGGGRPVVYSALESHGSYPFQGSKRVCWKSEKWNLCSVDNTGQGVRWDPLSGPGALRDVRAEGWYGFGGSWGKANDFLGSDTTGPLGPSRYKWPGGALPEDPGGTP